MNRWSRRLDFDVSDQGSGERGAVMIAAILATMSLVIIGALMTTFVVAASKSTQHSSGVSQAAVAAESGIDSTLALLESPGATLPCGWGPTTLTQGDKPVDVEVTITYYTDKAANTPMTCSQQTGLVGTPQAAFVESVATSEGSGEQSQMQLLAQLNREVVVAPAPSFDKAIFSDHEFSPSNNMNENGFAGYDADVYSNGAVDIANNMEVQGDIDAQSTVYLNNNAVVRGSVHAVGNVTIENNARVYGDVTSSSGSVTVRNNGRVDGSVFARQTITVGNGGVIVGSRNQNLTGLQPPAARPFPIVNWDASKWQSQGFTLVTMGGNYPCSDAVKFLTNQSLTNGAWSGSQKWQNLGFSKIVLRVPACPNTDTANGKAYQLGSGCNKDGLCGVTLSNNATVTAYGDIAVVSDDGFSLSNNVTVRSSSNTVDRKMWLITPSDSRNAIEPYPKCRSVSVQNKLVYPGSFKFENNVTFAAQMKTFLFTPCGATLQNNGSMNGMVYGGDVDANNNYFGKYYPMEIPGATEGTSSSPTNFQVDTLYKREVPVGS